MAITVLGAGFGRTGTMSLKLALEKLGVGRCYHMVEVFQNPGHAEAWASAMGNPHFDWETVLAGYGATVDWPSTTYWRELAAAYPKAKIILTVRSPESWYKSCVSTIFVAAKQDTSDAPPARQAQQAMVRKLVFGGAFEGRLDDAAFCMSVFEKHNEEVRRTIPAERLLVYETGQGWGPLCDFLGLPVPNEDYPKVNSTDEFRGRIGLTPT